MLTKSAQTLSGHADKTMIEMPERPPSNQPRNPAIHHLRVLSARKKEERSHCGAAPEPIPLTCSNAESITRPSSTS
jgi:hypothetical protein